MQKHISQEDKRIKGETIMATNNITIVSIFDEQSSAEHAIEDLYNAGIPSDRINYSRGSTSETSGGGFLESIKSLFTGGHDKTSHDVLNDLNNMGIPQEEAQYYAQQHDAGRTIVAIQPENLSQDALTILRSNGGYDYQGNWNRASAAKFAQTTSTGTTSDNTYRSQNVNQQTASTNDRTETDATTSPASNIASTETGAYNQDANAPKFTSQRRYADSTSASSINNPDVNNPNNTTNTSNQGPTAPSNPSQQAYVEPNRQSFSNPSQQAYTDHTQSGNTYNQNANAPQNQSDNPNANRIRTERNDVNRNADQDYEREQRNTTDQNPL